MTNAGEPAGKTWRDALSQQWNAFLREREEQVFLVLTLVIGALVGMVVVAFILLTERSGARLYPAGGSPWRRLLVPVAGSAIMGYLLYRFFPDARGSGVPQTKAAYTRAVGESRLARSLENSSAPRKPRQRASPGRRCDPARCAGAVRRRTERMRVDQS